MHLPSLFVLNWIITIVGAIGLVGLVACMIMAPAVFEVIVKLIMDFLGTRLGLAIVVGTACLYGGLTYGDLTGRSEERAICQANQVKADQEAKKRDSDIGAAAETDDQTRTTSLDLQQAIDEGKLNDLKSQLATAKNAPCVVTPDDLQRLQQFIGNGGTTVKVGGKSPAATKVPRARPGAGNQSR